MHINATLFGQMITFAIFVWFTMKVVWPILNSQLEERKKIIADGLAAAEEGRKILSNAEEEARKKISEARQHCYKILEQADTEAGVILEDARVQARKERDEIINSGHFSVQKAVNKAKKELQEQVADIAILGAEKILQRSVTAEDHAEALKDLAKNLS